jgi:hypothetical protein
MSLHELVENKGDNCLILHVDNLSDLEIEKKISTIIQNLPQLIK